MVADHFRGSEGAGNGSQVLDPSIIPGVQQVLYPEDASLADAMNDGVIDVQPVPDLTRQPIPDPYGEPVGGSLLEPLASSDAAQTAQAIALAQQTRSAQMPEVVPDAAGRMSPAMTGTVSYRRRAAGPAQGPVVVTQEPDYEPHGMYTSLVPSEDRAPVNRDLDPTISMRNVTKIYPAQPQKPALEDISLDIYPGEFVFIVGHSGSGKSTFLRLLTRELKVTSGEIMVAGQSLTKMRNWKVPFLRRQIGCVFQDFKLLQDRTTYENVAFSLECIGKPKSVIRAQVPEVLRLVGLADKMEMFPDQLSGGEQQRVSVARAMVNRPPLLICDEPTGNLDPAISLGIMKLLDAINRNGTTVIMATHDREMVDSMRKRVVALENGRLVRDQERGGYGFYGAI